MTLKEIPVGQSAVIEAVGGEGALRRHLLDMGVIPGAELTVVKLAPMGDPMEIQIHGYELTLRLADADQIQVTPIKARQTLPETSRVSGKAKHPGLGEDGIFHSRKDENPLPEGAILTYALVGNQNCGKTTLFNQLTGANQHVGNFPGVTVDRKDGVIKGHPRTLVTDLPGIYSMSPYSSEEIVSRNFVLQEKPKAIINIVDATNIERNLYLTMQLLEMNTPMVVALNMMDEVTGNGGSVDINRMENLLGVPVVPISASKNQGVDELVKHAIHVARYQERPLRQDFCDETDHNGAVHRCLHAVVHLIQDHAEQAGLPVRFAAAKLVEGDELVLEQLKLDQNEKEMLEHIITQMETERGLDHSAAMADMRFGFIEKVCAQTVVKPVVSKEHRRSQKLDSILTGKYTAIPCFIGIMALMFWLTFNVIGAWLQGLLETGIEFLTVAVDGWLAAAGVNEAIHSLIIDDIFAGVGSVLSFLPIIVTLFFFLSMLEDTGYMARIAFVMDKPLRRIGLSGKSIVPMLIGFGCSVPAIMATRTLTSERDRRMTVMLTPFMSCSAKIPIYTTFIAAFFPSHRALVMLLLYGFGVLCSILFALIAKKTAFRGNPIPFVMELPNYRLPSMKTTLLLMWDKAADFLKRAFTIIFAATVLIWFLQAFDVRLNTVTDPANSILASLGRIIAPLFAPLGLNDWWAITSLISGLAAKEAVISTLTVLLGTTDLSGAFTIPTAISFLTFTLLYTPCFAAIAAIKREMRSGLKTVGIVLMQCAIAWICGAVVYQLIGLFF